MKRNNLPAKLVRAAFVGGLVLPYLLAALLRARRLLPWMERAAERIGQARGKRPLPAVEPMTAPESAPQSPVVEAATTVAPVIAPAEPMPTRPEQGPAAQVEPVPTTARKGKPKRKPAPKKAPACKPARSRTRKSPASPLTNELATG